MSGLPSRRLGLSRGRPRPTVGIEHHPEVARTLTGDAAFPESFSLGSFEAPVFDQLDSESCFAHAAVQGVYTALGASGRKLPWVPSPVVLSRIVRALARSEGTPVGQPLPPLQNVGATDTDTFSALARFGVQPMEAVNPAGFTDCTDANINNEPQLGEVETSGQRLIVGPYSVAPDDPSLVTKLQAALYIAKAPIWVGNFADSAEMNWTEGSNPLGIPNTNDPDGGGHATLIDQWETVAGAVIFGKMGSWGAGYGIAGRCLVTPAWCASAWALWPMVVS